MDMAKAVDEKFWLKTTILFSKAGLSGNDGVGSLGELESANLWVFPTLDTLIARLDSLLHVSRMGTRLYAAGNEPLLGSVIKAALAHGIAHNSVFTEHRGSLRRRVQCVHCKGCTDDVTTNPGAVFPLWLDASRAGSLFAPHRRIPRRVHRRRGARRTS